jgi:hypothetical protein
MKHVIKEPLPYPTQQSHVRCHAIRLIHFEQPSFLSNQLFEAAEKVVFSSQKVSAAMASLYDAAPVRGDILELRDQLDGNDSTLRKSAAQRVVALMRSGENLQQLFSSMLRCVRTPDMELKKLTYLYLVQYSVHEPERAIVVVNRSHAEIPKIRIISFKLLRCVRCVEPNLTMLRKTG